MTSICKQINCPYMGEGQAYGCQRYTMSCSCHLRIGYPQLESNEYCLFGDMDIESAKRENDRFFLEDPRYAHDLKIQKKRPSRSFKVKEIQS